MEWILLPVTVFVAELIVITLSTLRTIFIARGRKALAALLGLLEVSIWLFAISQIMQNLDNVACFLAYAAGFTAGNFLGMQIEEKLALGTLVIRMITKKDATELIAALRDASYGVTSVAATGASGPVHVIFTLIKRRQLGHITELIDRFDPKTFYSVEDVREAQEGVFPRAAAPQALGVLGMLWPLGAGKAISARRGHERANPSS